MSRKSYKRKLDPDQLRSLELLHTEVLAAVEDGTFTYEQCYSWYASCVLWMCVAARIRKNVGEMQALTVHAKTMLFNYHSGILELDSDDIDVLKSGVMCMAELAKLTPLQVASESADVAENRVNDFLKELHGERKSKHRQGSG